jgi:hypothetical protein
MLCSRDYLRELLHGNDPIKSIFELANIWSSRPNRNETDPYFGLLPCQYAVHLYLNYQGDVGNGGHAQFFLNPVGAHSNETLAALKELGFGKIHGILSRAVSVFPGSQVPKCWQERTMLVETFPEDVLKLWARLDCELWSVSGTHWALLKYLQEHEPEILERDGG